MKNKKLYNKIIVIVWTIGIIFLAFYAVYIMKEKEKNVFVYEEHLDDVIITVDNQNITLRDFGYYIVKMENIVQQQALIYNAQDPTDYWNSHFSAGADTGYMFEYAWNYAVTDCICDLIYEQKAFDAGDSLSLEECKMVMEQSREIYASLSDKQIKNTGLTLDIITQVEARKMLVKQYASANSTGDEASKYIDDVMVYVTGIGEIAADSELLQHEIVYDADIEHNVHMGKITVNCDDSMKNNSNHSDQRVLREELLNFIPEKAKAFSL